MVSTPDAAPTALIVGSGICGLLAAYVLSYNGFSVTVVCDMTYAPAHGAAGGMLAPVAELAFTEPKLHALLVQSCASWPSLLAALSRDARVTSLPITQGTVLVGMTRADLTMLSGSASVQSLVRQSSDLLRQREPALSARIAGGWYSPHDHAVDPEAVIRQLRRALALAPQPVEYRELQITRVTDGRIMAADGTALSADLVVCAAGAATAQLLAGHPAAGQFTSSVRPVQGCSITVPIVAASPTQHVVRGLVDGDEVYVVPHPGRLVIGASSVEQGFNPHPRLDDVHRLLRAAIALVPELAALSEPTIRGGLRPATEDHLPVVRPLSSSLWACTGHYRSGIALAPWTYQQFQELAGLPPDSQRM